MTFAIAQFSEQGLTLGDILRVGDLFDARPPQFLADLMGNPPGLTTADGHFGQIGQTVGRLLERTGAPRGPDDLPQHGRREVVRAEPQGRAEREKNPGGRPGNGPSVRRG